MALEVRVGVPSSGSDQSTQYLWLSVISVFSMFSCLSKSSDRNATWQSFFLQGFIKLFGTHTSVDQSYAQVHGNPWNCGTVDSRPPTMWIKVWQLRILLFFCMPSLKLKRLKICQLCCKHFPWHNTLVAWFLTNKTLFFLYHSSSFKLFFYES